MIILVCKLFPKDERLEFNSPEDVVDFLAQFLPCDFKLEIDGNSYSWSQLCLSNKDMLDKHKEIATILDHLEWCLEIDEAFYKE
jgi:hypothetical protein